MKHHYLLFAILFIGCLCAPISTNIQKVKQHINLCQMPQKYSIDNNLFGEWHLISTFNKYMEEQSLSSTKDDLNASENDIIIFSDSEIIGYRVYNNEDISKSRYYGKGSWYTIDTLLFTCITYIQKSEIFKTDTSNTGWKYLIYNLHGNDSLLLENMFSIFTYKKN